MVLLKARVRYDTITESNLPASLVHFSASGISAFNKAVWARLSKGE